MGHGYKSLAGAAAVLFLSAPVADATAFPYEFPAYSAGFGSSVTETLGSSGLSNYQFSSSDPSNASQDYLGKSSINEKKEVPEPKKKKEVPEPKKIKEVPEPGTLALFGLGLAGLSLSRRRKA